eukprot:s1232_g17.t1
MLVTKTKHLAVQVAFDEQVPKASANPSSPRAVSERGDLMIYYAEESCFSILADLPFNPDDVWNPTHGHVPKMEARGPRLGDKKGILPDRSAKELALAATRMKRQDPRAWTAPKREYTLAEQHATNGFRNTVVFEPFGGNYGLTRLGASEFRWTCSQPLDLVDGYDLLSRTGKSLLFRVLHEHRPFLLMVADCRM